MLWCWRQEMPPPSQREVPTSNAGKSSPERLPLKQGRAEVRCGASKYYRTFSTARGRARKPASPRSKLRRNSELLVPRTRGLNGRIDGVDVLHPVALQPFFQSLEPLLGVDRYAVFPSRPAAQNARVLRTSLRRHIQ